MFSSATFLSLLLLTISAVEASPSRQDQGIPSVLTVASRIAALGGKSLVDLDRQRAASLIENANYTKSGKRSGVAPISNSGVVFDATVTVGSAATKYTLLVDTGSSNTWVGSRKTHPYKMAGAAKKTGETVSVTYGSGHFSGYEVIDSITLAPGVTIQEQSIGIATSASGFSDVDGILGIGPTDLTTGTLSNQAEEIPTVIDNLVKSDSISEKVLGIYFAPSAGSPKGELSFGQADSSKTTEAIAYVPITSSSPASRYWGIDQSITYGSQTLLAHGSGIVDTGTTLILVSDDAFATYEKATGGKLDSNTNLLKITQAQYSALQPLDFHIGSGVYTLNANAQIWPRSLNSDIGGDSDSIYLVLQSFGKGGGNGWDFISGFSFLQRFYSVYDATNKRVGFAKTGASFNSIHGSPRYINTLNPQLTDATTN
ncbi:hypothetical protein HWV62_36436 [Athelia sp. TMB]|nr:hypothetical protein HWV62_36436 [Athelia sp. TMB]